MKVIVVDTGYKQGGILFWDNGPVKIFPISTVDWIELVREACDFDAPVFVETPLIMPMHGKKTTLSIGKGYGRLEMMKFLCSLEWEEIHPKTWQHGLGLNRTKGEKYEDHKNRLYEEASKRYECDKETADAYLIAEYLQNMSSV